MFEEKKINIDTTVVYLLYYSDFLLSDYYSFLTEEELKKVQSFKNENRQREVIATRILKHRICGNRPIQYNVNGAPYIKGVGHISISHSLHTVAIAVNRSYKIGIDLEPYTDRARRLQSKFLSEDEKNQLNTTSEKEMTIAWSLKEALYKLAGRKEIIFSTDLLLRKIDAFTYSGKIINKNHIREMELKVIELEKMVLTLNTSPINIVENV